MDPVSKTAKGCVVPRCNPTNIPAATVKLKKTEICEKTYIIKRISLREELKMIYVKWEEKSADIFIILMNVTNWTISGDDMSFVESQVSSMPDSALKKRRKM